MERTITIQQIKDVAQEAYNLYKDNTEGKMPITFLIWLISIRNYSVSVFA